MGNQNKKFDEKVENIVDHGSEAPTGSEVTNAGVEKMRKKIQSATSVISPTVDAHVDTKDYGGSGCDTNGGATRVGMRLAGLTTGAFGGNEGAILGNLSGTGKFSESKRSGSRQGQKLDEPVRKIDQLASEQIVQEVTIPTPLEQNPDEGMGYMGQPLNQNTRNQKSSGIGPMDMMYQRSIDEIDRDMVVYTYGQRTQREGQDESLLPKMTHDSVYGRVRFLPGEATNDYIGVQMDVAIPNGVVKGIFYHDEVVTSRTREVDEQNAANSTLRRELNRTELDAQAMLNEAGNATKENFSPLGGAVDTPDSTNALLRALEEIQGSHYYMADRFMGKALSYQLNRAAKDGQRPVATRNEMLMGYSAYSPEGTVYNGDQVPDPSNNANTLNPFSADAYRHGAPGLLIAVGDTVTKYRTRGDLLNQPRGFKLAYSAIHGRAGALKMRPILGKVVSAQDTFSTIDSEYDPLKPIYVTDGFALAQPICHRTLGTYYTAKRVTTKFDASNEAGVGSYLERLHVAEKAGKGLVGKAEFTFNTNAIPQGSSSYTVPYIVKPVYPDSGKDVWFTTEDAAAQAISKAVEQAGGSEAFEHIVFIAGCGTTAKAFMVSVNVPVIATLTKASMSLQLSSTLDAGTYTIINDTAVSLDGVSEVEVYPQDYVYHYSNRGTNYTSMAHSSLHAGLIEWFKKHDGDIYAASGTTQSDRVQSIAIPMGYTTRHISTFSGFLAFALTDVLRDRATAMYDVLRYENANGHYPYSDFVSLADVDVNASLNYQFVDTNTMLKAGRMIEDVAFTWKHPELFWMVKGTYPSSSTTDGKATVLLPDYISSETFGHEAGTGMLARRHNATFSVNVPCFREGKQLQSAQDLHTNGLTNNRLIGDRMVCPDQLDYATVPDGARRDGGIYKYSQLNSGVPTIYVDYSGGSAASALMGVPRELGLFQVAPCGFVTPAYNVTSKASGASASYDWFVPTDYQRINPFMNSSYKMICYRNAKFMVDTANDQTRRQPTANANSNVVLTQASNFQQIYQILQAGVYLEGTALVADAAPTTTAGGTLYYRTVPELGQRVRLSDIARNFNNASRQIQLTDRASSAVPFTDVTGSMPNIFFLSSLYYNRLNKLDAFFVSPFDVCPRIAVVGGQYQVAPAVFDPYDLQFIFNFCGMLPAEYDEDVNDRLRKIIEADWLYVDEEWFSKVSYLT